jgi:hypothetical protein
MLAAKMELKGDIIGKLDALGYRVRKSRCDGDGWRIELENGAVVASPMVRTRSMAHMPRSYASFCGRSASSVPPLPHRSPPIISFEAGRHHAHFTLATRASATPVKLRT